MSEDRAGADRLAPRAWLTIGQAFTTTGLVFGIWFAFAVFLVAMVEDFGWTRAGASVAFSVGNLLQAVLSPVVGLLVDRWGPRRVTLAGLLASALALAACSLLQTLWQLVLLFGVGVAGGVALAGPVTLSALLATWFVRLRGTILGFAFAGMGVGILVFAPLTQYLVLRVGWRQAFLALALVTGVQLVGLALTLRGRPGDVGLAPYGAVAPGTGATPPGGTAGRVPRSAHWSVAEAVRTREFWALSIVQVLIPIGIYPVAVHQVAYLVDAGFSKPVAAAVLGQMGLMSACGRILFGALSDRVGRFGGVAASVLCSQAGIVVLLLIPDARVVWPLYLYAVLFGLGFGARGPIMSAIAADLFPGRRFGVILGLISIGHGIGGALGPWYAGYVHDRAGSYTFAFLIALLALVGVVAGFWVATRRLALPRHR